MSDDEVIISAIKSLLLSRQCFKTEQEYNHSNRCQLDPLIYQVLQKKYMNDFSSHWNDTVIPMESERAIVIVERRCHPNLEFCIKNAVYFARGFSLYIFCSYANLEFVKTICGNQKDSVHIIPVFETIGTPEEGKEVYNKLLCDKEFWNRIQADVCLMIETDSYLRAPLPESIFEYDYVASKWPWLRDEPGGGGLSIRKRSMMLDICERTEGPVDIMQDSFTSNGVIAHGYTYPSWEESERYFSEGGYFPQACGVHQWWTFIGQLDSATLQTIVNAYLTLFV